MSILELLTIAGYCL